MINFLLAANVTHTLEWRFDADTKAIASYLDRHRPDQKTLPADAVSRVGQRNSAAAVTQITCLFPENDRERLPD